MASDLRTENILIQIRTHLQQNGIKLWDLPYYMTETGPVELEVEKLSKSFSQLLNIPYEYCYAAVTELQSHALEKLGAMERYRTTGVATIKVRVPNQHHKENRLLTVHLKLTDLVANLQDEIVDKIGLDNQSKIKLISDGRILQSNQTLENQRVKNNQQIMAIILNNEAADDQTKEDQIYQRIQKAKDDVQLLIDSRSDQYKMQMEDQDGNAVYLPPDEKRNLLVALTMHEMGRTAIKRQEYTEALILLLEADSEFNACKSKQLLEAVDNYALLNLDIVWCYLCLKNITQLPDAEVRLKKCEQNFQKSYGTNLDRVQQLKGNSANEKALIMRLHLLQAILCYHQNRTADARAKLFQAETELQALHVSDESLSSVVNMGFSLAEARLGLRAAGGNTSEAIRLICERKQKRTEARLKSTAESDLMRQLRTIGKGTGWTDARKLLELVGMGFDRELSALALKKTNNNLYEAINLLHESRSELIRELSVSLEIDGKITHQLKEMGYDQDTVTKIMTQFYEKIPSAIDILIRMKDGDLSDGIVKILAEFNEGMDVSGIDEAAGFDVQAGPSRIRSSVEKQLESTRNAKDAYSRLYKGLGREDDSDNEDGEEINLTLVEEEKLLIEYRKLLNP